PGHGSPGAGSSSGRSGAGRSTEPAAGAPADHAPRPAPTHEAFETVRVELAELDALLDRLFEVASGAAELRRALAAHAGPSAGKPGAGTAGAASSSAERHRVEELLDAIDRDVGR